MLYPPIITVGSPTAAIAPQMQASVVLSAGLPAISTVALPVGNALTMGWGTGMGHMCISPATADGFPPISTVGTPGPDTIPPWFETSVILAAGGIVCF